MSQHIEGLNRNQTYLLPETLEQYVDQDNPARFIDTFTEHLNLQNMGFTHSTPNETGRPSYNPKDLLKLYIYGYLNQIRTSRKLERECHAISKSSGSPKNLPPTTKP